VKKIIQNLKDELKKSKNSFPEILSAKSNGRASSTRRYRAGEYERIVSPSDEVKLNKLRVTELKNFSQINWDNASPFSRSDKGSKSSIKRTEEDVQKVLLTERESIKITEVSESAFSAKNDIDSQTQKRKIFDKDFHTQNKTPEKMKTVYEKRVYKTVTETQGRRGSQSLFLDNFNRLSFFQLTNEEMTKAWENPSLVSLVKLLEQEDEEIIEALQGSNDLEKNDIFETIKSLLGDIKGITKVVLVLRKLLKASSIISTSLVLNEALEKISQEIKNVLGCDKASVYIADYVTRTLWTKVSNGSNEMVQTSFDEGIVGYSMTQGKSVRIDEAHFDPRFDKEIDTKSYYQTKSILVVPIKDSEGNILGVCQARNKIDGHFSEDDEVILEMLSIQAGVQLKNSMKFDKTLILQYKTNLLLRHVINMCEANSLTALFVKAEAGLKYVFSSEKGLVYIVNQDNRSYYRINEDGDKVIFPFEVGFIGQAALKKKIIEIKNPNFDTNFNSKVDVETHLPLLSIPIFSLYDPQKVVAVIQVIDISLTSNKIKAKTDSFECESLKIFIDMLRACVDKATKMENFDLKKVVVYENLPDLKEGIATFGNLKEETESLSVSLSSLKKQAFLFLYLL